MAFKQPSNPFIARGGGETNVASKSSAYDKNSPYHVPHVDRSSFNPMNATYKTKINHNTNRINTYAKDINKAFGQTGAYSDADGNIFSGRGAGGQGPFQGGSSDPHGNRSAYSGTNFGHSPEQAAKGQKYNEAHIGRYDFDTGETFYRQAGAGGGTEGRNEGAKSSQLTTKGVGNMQKEFGYDATIDSKLRKETVADLSKKKTQPKRSSIQTNVPDVNVSPTSKKGSRTQNFTNREARQLRRNKRRQERQQRQESRRRDRQINRRNNGGFFKRLADKIF